MSPFIRDGDTITIAPVAAAGLRHGDVVALRRPDSGQVVVHRVVKRRGAGQLRTKGDNLYAADAAVAPQAFCGRVVRIERGGRRMPLGLGPERHLIAWLSAAGVLPLLLHAGRRLQARLRRRPADAPGDPNPCGDPPEHARSRPRQ